MLIGRRGAAQTRRPSLFLAFQLWPLLHGMTDLRAGKPEMPWPGPELADLRTATHPDRTSASRPESAGRMRGPER
jgi:hypothetical protein